MSEQQIIKDLSNVNSQKYLYEFPSQVFNSLERFFKSSLFRNLIMYSRLFFVTLSIFLFAAVILLFFKSKPFKKFRKALFGTALRIPKNKVQVSWSKVQKRIELKNEAEYKMAVIEADKIFDSMLALIGFKGDTMGDKLKLIAPSQLESLEGIWEAHKLRNRIVHNPDESISLSEAEKAVENYRRGLEELDIL